MEATLKIKQQDIWYIKCQSCGKLHASASEKELLPKWSNCNCDKK